MGMRGCCRVEVRECWIREVHFTVRSRRIHDDLGKYDTNTPVRLYITSNTKRFDFSPYRSINIMFMSVKDAFWLRFMDVVGLFSVKEVFRRKFCCLRREW